MIPNKTINVYLPKPHQKQKQIAQSKSKYKCVRAGRRGGKTVFAAREAVKRMFANRQVFLASPSQKQVDSFWRYAKLWLYDAIESGLIIKNEQSRTLSFANPKGRGRIECRTARFPDELRGGFGDFIVLDEAAFLDESALDEVIYPMLWDNDGDLWLLSTPKAGTWFNDLCLKIQNGEKPEWEEFYFTSLDNPHISQKAIERAKDEMTERAWKEEGLALLLDEVKGALWKRSMIERRKVSLDKCKRIVVAIDPSVSSNPKSNETGIVVVGKVSDDLGVVLEDGSGVMSPREWAECAIRLFHKWGGDRIIAEKNQGGDLVETNIRIFSPNVPIKLVHASKGKFARAEPVAALYEKDKIYHAEVFEELENQMTTWTIDAPFSPDRIDALVWGLTELFLEDAGELIVF